MEQEGIKVPVNLVNFGAASPDPKFANMRAYIYFNARRMIIENGFYIGDTDVEDELVKMLPSLKPLQIPFLKYLTHCDTFWILLIEQTQLQLATHSNY